MTACAGGDVQGQAFQHPLHSPEDPGENMGLNLSQSPGLGARFESRERPVGTALSCLPFPAGPAGPRRPRAASAPAPLRGALLSQPAYPQGHGAKVFFFFRE